MMGYGEALGSVQDLRRDLRTGGRLFDPQAWPIFAPRGLMIAIVTRFIPLSLLSIVSTMVMWKSSQWLGKNIVRGAG